jgi:hypothetical protein
MYWDWDFLEAHLGVLKSALLVVARRETLPNPGLMSME